MSSKKLVNHTCRPVPTECDVSKSRTHVDNKDLTPGVQHTTVQQCVLHYRTVKRDFKCTSNFKFAGQHPLHHGTFSAHYNYSSRKRTPKGRAADLY